MTKDNNNLWIRWKYENMKYHGRKHAEEYAESDQTLLNSSDHVAIRNWLLDHLNLTEKKINRLLDLGCGTGRWFHVLEDVDFVLGVDFSGEMLNKAKEKIYGGREHTNNINLVQCDIFNLPLKKVLFDCVVSIGTLGWHMPINDEIFEEVKHVLKKDGIFLFTAKKGEKLSKLEVIAAQLLWPILPNSFTEKHEFGVKTFHKKLDHNEQTLRKMAYRCGFDIYEIKIDFMIKSEFYFVCARKRIK